MNKKFDFVNMTDDDFYSYMGVEENPMICKMTDEMMGLLSYDVNVIIDNIAGEWRLSFYFYALNKVNHDYCFIYVGDSSRSSKKSIIEYAESVYNFKGHFNFEVFQANRFEIDVI